MSHATKHAFAITFILVLTTAARAGTSNSLMDISLDGKMLLVANADNGSVTLVDTATNKAVREIKVGEKPEGVTWISNSSLAAVTIYKESLVVFFNPLTGDIVKKLRVPPEPYGIVADKEGRRAWVTHEYPGVVAEIDLKEQKVARELPAGSMVRGIALSPDEKRVYVTEFYTGILRALDAESGKEVDSWKGHSTDNLSRHVLLHPRRPKAYLPHIRSMVTVNHGAGSIFPQLTVCDLKPGEGRRRVSFAMDTFNSLYVVTNPWEAAMSPDGQRIYIIYAATNDMNVCKTIDDDYKEIDHGPIVQLGQNPRAIRVSPDGQKVYILNALDFAVSVHKADTMSKLATVKVCDPPKTPEWVEGKILFNTAKPPLTSRRWVACSSCHPDGHHDGRVWQQPEGLRKTTALFGMAHTHPLHFSADRDEVQDFEFTIRSPLMQGAGLAKGYALKSKVAFNKVELEVKTSGQSKALDAMAIYSNSFDFVLSPHIPAPGKLSAAAERGKTLFFSKELGCAQCHSGPYFSDSSLQKPYKLHDVGTGRDDKTERMGTLYDTPTLLGIYRTAPYLHDGQARTLREVLTLNKEDKHGKTSHLKGEELDDLVEFLKSLPYEPPPAMTPNAVEYRVQAVSKQ
jgi:YVTN family beta-propeller protein